MLLMIFMLDTAEKSLIKEEEIEYLLVLYFLLVQ
jgi:hypothetical protein